MKAMSAPRAPPIGEFEIKRTAPITEITPANQVILPID